MSNELVRYEARPPAVLLTMNRPDRRNALSRGLIAALTESFGAPRGCGGALRHSHRRRQCFLRRHGSRGIAGIGDGR